MLEEVFGASMAPYGFDFFRFKEVGGCRWLMDFFVLRAWGGVDG